MKKKNYARQLTLKIYSCYGLKKPLCKEFDNEKTLLRLKNSHPPPPIIFLMVRPLEAFSSVYCVMSPDMCW